MTLRQRGFTSCEHPAKLREPHLSQRGQYAELMFCGACGAQQIDGEWRGGTLDFDAEQALLNWGSFARWWEASGQ